MATKKKKVIPKKKAPQVKTAAEDKPIVLTAKQRLFCESYIIDFNATQAAIRSGYSKGTACVIGWENLRKPYIKAEIKRLAEERFMTPEETKKLITDISKGCVNDYMTIKMVEHTPRVTKNIKELISELEERIIFEDQFAAAAGFTEERLEAHTRDQDFRKEKLLWYNLMQKKNPKYSEIVNGETVFVETAELDLVKLARDKELGRIKSIAYGPNGPKIELYAADAALANIAKMHGLFEKDNQQSKVTEKQVFVINGKQIEF